MKNISEGLQLHLSGEVTTLATCWKLERRDGVASGFTDHDMSIVIDGLEYKAQTGFTPSAVQTTAGFSVDNLDIEGILDDSSITEEDIMSGVYDFAEIEVFMANYNDLSQGKLILRTGWLGEVSFSKNHFIAEVRGLAQALGQKIGDVFSPNCRALFCDSKCGLSESAYTEVVEVTGVISRRVFECSELDNPAGYFSNGKVKFNSGANNGFKMEVKDFTNGVISLVMPLPFDIETGDIFEITAGCDKNFKTCADKFSNAVNFRGEPHVPGMDKILETSGTRRK